MLRREIRKRKEYLYFKNKEALEKSTLERKKKLKAALEEGKPIPTELYNDEAELRKIMAYDDSRWETPEMDCEYRSAGIEDPRIVVTTSRNPSSRLKCFLKEIRLLFPNSQRLNRGHSSLKDIMSSCISYGASDLIFLHETRGSPDCLIISHLPYGPTAYFTLYNVVMRHDIPDVGPPSEANPHLIFHNFSKPLGNRTMTILKCLFPVPKEDSSRVISFINQNDFISFRQHVYSKDSDSRNPILRELGPRFEMKLFRIVLGTFIQREAECEWQLKPFLNVSRKRFFLGEQTEDPSDEDEP